MKNYKNIYLLIKNNKFNFDIDELNKIKEETNDSFEYSYLKGFAFLNINKINDAIENFSNAIKINQENVLSFFYRGIAYLKLNKLDLAKLDYEKAISLKPDFPELYNNLANINYKNGNNEEAIKNYSESLKLNNNLKSSALGLLNVLSQTENTNDSELDLVNAHNELNKINFNYIESKKIDNEEIKKILNQMNQVMDKNQINLDLNLVQAYKENKFAPNCKRHHKIFNAHNIIPENCFSCYKVQIEPETVIDLIKLYIIFDNIEFKNNNIRKCTIELRPAIPGKYKSLIYCKTIKEAENISKQISSIIENKINKKIPLKIKRGCSEFAIKFPKYNNLKKDLMMYDNSWKNYENFFDEENLDYIFEKKTRPTIKSITLFDAVVIRNWLAFAKIIGDDSYKLISNREFYSKFIEEKIKAKVLQKQKLN